jgi:hypothetical protein
VELKKMKLLYETKTKCQFLTNLLIKITGEYPKVGRRKIRGAVVACGLAVRIFLIFSSYYQVENPDFVLAKSMK